MRIFLRAKIHNATVTEANLHYIGSITIDETLMRKADIRAYEKVLVVNNTNGNRIETYVIRGEEGSGVICMNGGAAHLFSPGDEIIIMAFESLNAPPRRQPRIVLVDDKNRFVRYHRVSTR